MWCAYVFTVLAVIGLFGLIGWLNPFTFLLATWVSQQFLQLVFLPILSVGQNVLSRKQELQADEMFATSQKSFTDIEQIMRHLTAQDQKILEIEQINRQQLASLTALQAQLQAQLLTHTQQPTPLQLTPPQNPPDVPTAPPVIPPLTTTTPVMSAPVVAPYAPQQAVSATRSPRHPTPPKNTRRKR